MILLDGGGDDDGTLTTGPPTSPEDALAFAFDRLSEYVSGMDMEKFSIFFPNTNN